VNTAQLTRLLQDLVRLPSVNPRSDPNAPAAITGEARMADYLADFLHKLGLDVERHDVEPGRPNVIGKFSSRGGKRSVALAPHTDTVSAAGMTVDPFAAEIRDGRLYGRGAVDTKASLAAGLAALTRVSRDKSFRAGDLDVWFCALASEENGNQGARVLTGRGFKADFAIAGEPTRCRVVHAHKGALWLKITTRGRTAHGATPDLGESAIAKMADVIRYVLGEYAARLKAAPDPVLGPATVNVGVIHGGSGVNIVPARCEIQLDRRLVGGETGEAVLAELRRALAAIPVDIELLGMSCPILRTDPAHPFVGALARATGRPEPLTTMAGFTDAAIFAGHGIPAVVFGPGDMAQAHAPDEFVELAQVEEAARILERFLSAAARAQ
jgi:acetylornithine deacetylase/succinyl-diaminopimelate desuccinylase family protein